MARKAIEKGTKITHKNTLFAGLGDFGKSGSMISYNFRVINELSEENFGEYDDLIEERDIENIVLIDDIISTGNQASKEIKKLTEKVTPLGVRNIFLLTVCGMKDGIIKVEEETKAYTFSAFEYSTKDTVTDLDGKFYEGLSHEVREKIYKRIMEYGKIAHKSNPLGYGNIGGLIAFEFNTPNTSLPIIWSNANSWIPLFKRAKRINGIKSYYKQFEKKQKTTNKPKNELSIYVEGKNEEIFFDILQRENNIAEILGFKKINIIALGGSMISKKLINQLSNIDYSYIFVLERDRNYQRVEKILKSENIKMVYMNPNIMGFFRIEDLIKDETHNKELAKNLKFNENIFFELETLLLKRIPPSLRAKKIKENILIKKN